MAVAPLTEFVCKAYSPKESPYCIILSLFPPLEISISPFFITKNESAWSPSFTIISPALKYKVIKTEDIAAFYSSVSDSTFIWKLYQKMQSFVWILYFAHNPLKIFLQLLF